VTLRAEVWTDLVLTTATAETTALATAPAIPTGFWDRRPQPRPGRLRRALARCPFPHDVPLPARIRAKRSRTGHLPTGFWGQRRRRKAPPAPPPLDLAA